MINRLSKNSICGRLTRQFSNLHATTVLVVRKDTKTILIGDGQVSQGSSIVKANAKKIRQLREGVVCGFAGGVADAIALMELLEVELEKYKGFTLLRPCTELAKQWRQNKLLRHLQATMLVCDKDSIVEIDGTGNVFLIDSVRAIGSGGLFAECAAEAMYDFDIDAVTIGKKAMQIAANKCVYTNDKFVYEILESTTSTSK